MKDKQEYQEQLYEFRIKYIDSDGKTKTSSVPAENAWRAVQKAGVFGKFIVSCLNMDL